MNRLVSCVIASLLVFLASCAPRGVSATSTPAAMPLTGKIVGQIIDANDGHPIPFANVMTEPPTSSVSADELGNYSISAVPPGVYAVTATKSGRMSATVKVSVTAGALTTADLHFGSASAQLPTPVPTPTADYSPVFPGTNLLVNGSLDEERFGTIPNWSYTNLDLLQWYLVQNVPPDSESENSQWIEWVGLSFEGRGHGLKSTDYQNCGSFCSVEAVQLVEAHANRVYTLSAESRIEQGNGGTLYLDFLDAKLRRIKVHTRGGFGEQWGQQSVTATAPVGTQYIRVILYSSNKTQGVIYWDNVILLEGE